MISTQFANHRLVLDKRGVLFWPARKLMIVSDLHLGKGDSLNRYGNPIPALDARDTIERLAEAIDAHAPTHVVCLGDSFHDHASEARLPDDERALLVETISRVDCWTWIVGNHDPDLPQSLPGERVPSLTIGGVTLAHQPTSSDAEIIGHFHPKTSISVGGRKVRGRCFLQTDRTIVMPAFGSYTGGLAADDPALQAVVGPQPSRFLIYQDRVWPLRNSA